jgi:hypothetical protein
MSASLATLTIPSFYTCAHFCANDQHHFSILILERLRCFREGCYTCAPQLVLLQVGHNPVIKAGAVRAAAGSAACTAAILETCKATYTLPVRAIASLASLVCLQMPAKS